MAEAEPTPIATIRKNTREEVRVALASYHGTQLVDVRIYVDGRGDERVPTPKGIALRLELLPALIEALQEAERG